MKLQQGESVLHGMHPQKSLLTIWVVSKCLPLTILGSVLSTGFAAAMAGIFTQRMSDEGWGCLFGVVGAASLLIVFPAITIAYHVALLKSYTYTVTNQRVVFKGGILRRVERSVPYHKVTDVETSQTLVERILGIWTLKIFTPGTASVGPSGRERAEITFAGLKDAETPASTVNEMLRQFRATGE